MENNIYELALKCLDNNIKIRQNKVVVPKMVFYDFDVLGEKEEFIDNVSNLIIPVATKYPSIAKELQEHIRDYQGGEIIIHHSSIIAILKCLIEIEKPVCYQNKRKIFISHSSKDKVIIKAFTNHILELGIGIGSDDVFCTSIEDMAMRNGEDIRQHIKDNILSADYSILMLSKKYQSSEICLNEMGAVWTANNKVRYYLLPDADFDRIGWLNNPKKAEKINSSIALDALQKELIDFYGLQDKGLTWSENREDFLAILK